MKKDIRKTQPRIRTIGEINLPEPEKYILDNGIPVYLIDAGTQELVRIELIFDAGSYYQSKALQAYLTNKCLSEGTESYSSKTIAETIDFYGAYLKSSNEKDTANISLYTLNKHLDKLLPVLHEVSLIPTFPEEEIRTIVRKQHQEYLVNMEKVSFIARQQFSSLLFGEGHPYGKIAMADDYGKVNSTVLRQFFKERYQSAQFTIIISGKVPGDIIERLNRYFGKHVVKKKSDLTSAPIPKPATDLNQFIKKDGTLQSALRLGKTMFNKLHPDYTKFKVLNTVLGGYFGSRLMTNIREDKGYTYGIGSGIASFKHAGMFFIASEVGTEVTKKAIDEVFIEIERLRTTLVPREELELVKNYMTGQFLRRADGPFALAELVRAILPYKLDMNYYKHYIRTIKNITAEEICNLAVNYLQPDSMIRLVVGEDVPVHQ